MVSTIRSLFCNAALLAALGCLVPSCHFCAPFLVSFTVGDWNLSGRWTASKSLRIWSPYLIGEPRVLKWPLSFQIAACACGTRKAYLESVSMATLFPFPSSKAQIMAMSSANRAEVPGGKTLGSVVSKLETTAYPALLFPSKTKLLPSVYQISSELVRGSSDNPFRVFAQWSKVSRQDWKGREPSRICRRVAGLRTSHGDIVRPGFSFLFFFLKLINLF